MKGRVSCLKYSAMQQFSFTDIQQILKDTCRYEGNTALVYDGFRPVMECEQHHISWIRPKVKKAAHYINNTKAGCIICDEDAYKQYTGSGADTLFIISPDPLLAFVKILHKVEDRNKTAGPLIHPTAIIHPGCKLGANVSIGPFSILDECTIGDNSVIGNNVRIHSGVIMGRNCQVREFCSIGGAGFGIVKDEDGNNMHVPHIGRAVIGDNVLIFPYSNVDKGMLGDTVIENNVVIDHYCHIGHNTFTGKNTIITAGVVMAGGSRIGNNCFIGVHTVVKEKAEIGAYVTTGMGSVVTANIPDNQTWVGNPATEIKSFVAQRAFVKKGSAD